ncbi:outer membrane lipoprotein carrier protein LolA [Chitinophaga pinensis]|uniref:Outer membrane lipoprotein carrier protein LolA n=1 Tax=Chitinophaga pinensis (strain ATCC 43595 / DSM 2588 / LMG 13176 / NBRC 15968 / NCIMB 11800 / UQM 2034) TaxID=485918 RepID=A0A979G1Y9_CHIPD|nr:outer membrane lipoprotein carrier protein LolA [Chitinophaga pinensis]ACU59365.1 outer membrane lipoprotein carrier protein LolA [Chitinophaga pinensis DSM 2588]
MRRWLLILGCIVSTLPMMAQTGFKPVADVAAFKQQFAKASQATQSIQCDFVQEKNLSMLADKITSKGKFWFKKENKVRMEYAQPSYYLLVMNGKDIKVKDGQKENRVSTKGNKLFEQINKITIDCVQGNIVNNADFNTRVLENGQSYLLEMTPVNKALSQYFKSIHLLVDKKDYSVSKIEMYEAGGDDTSISFLHKQMNVNIADAVFAVK